MTNVLDYVKWRGDLTFSQDAFNAVDALVLSSVVYVKFEHIPTEKQKWDITLREAADIFFQLDHPEEHARMKEDVELFRLASDSVRFGNIRIVGYGNTFAPEQDTQFAAMSFDLGDGTLCGAFRGTDSTLVGWKEDFNMAYLESVPAQRLALRYVQDLDANFDGRIRLCGHSKGGNLAVYAAAMCGDFTQHSILEIYNFDGPGFTEHMLQEKGYKAILPKIHTFIPQSSIVGMMLEHEEEFTVIHSDGHAIFQHDSYTWEVMGKELIPVEQITSDSVFVNAALKEWLAAMTPEERGQFIEALFSLAGSGLAGSGRVRTAFQPNNLINAFRTLSEDEQKRDVLTKEFSKLFDSFRRVMKTPEEQEEAELAEIT